MRRPLLVVVGVLTAVGLSATACGSSPAATTTTSGGASTTTAASTGSSTTAASGSAPALPAVHGASDLQHEPSIAAGSAPAPTQLETKDLVAGTGTVATMSSTVKVQYVGANYATGKDFDASWTDSGPIPFSLSQVVPGFAQGITGMKVGGRREIVIPPALGYGAAGNGPVGPNETLVFVVDLLAVQ